MVVRVLILNNQLGIGELKLLSERSRTESEVRLMNGREYWKLRSSQPDKYSSRSIGSIFATCGHLVVAFLRFTRSKWRYCKEERPESQFKSEFLMKRKLRSRYCKFDRFPRLGGTIPMKEAYERSRCLRFLSEPIKFGIGIPWKSFRERSRTESDVKLTNGTD